MSRANKIKYIVPHCTAGFASAYQVQNYFLRPKSQGGRGWNTGGYHRIIERSGKIEKMYDFEKVTNGVQWYNSECIHISYVGGINYEKSKKGIFIAEDTRTPEQKHSITICIIEAIDWLKENGKDITKDLMVIGHRDFSKDKNNNNIIESWERIKECPSYDAIPENLIYSATNSILTLPSNR